MAPSPIGRKLAAARRRSGKTLSALEQLSGVPASTISAIETGETRNPGIFTLEEIARGLGLSLVDLLGATRGRRKAA